ncbi:MAG: glycosyltransferase [bacterium]
MSFQKPEISVIIPVYNGENYIKETIISVLNQTYTDYELIIVDDGSTDSTKKIIQSFSDPRIIYYYQKNSGPNTTRNTGINLAKGEFIAFLDADDIWLPHKLAIQLREIKENPEIGLVYGWVYYIDSNSNLIGRKKYNIKDDFYINLLLGNFVDNGSTPLIRKKCFDKVGGFDDLKPAGDWDMWIRIAKEFKFSYVKDYIALYRIHSTGISKDYKQMETKLFYILDREFCSNNPKLEKIKNKAYSYRYHYLSGVCRNLMCYKDAAAYMLKAVKTYPPILLEKSRILEIIKLFLIMLIPKSIFKHIRDTFKNFLLFQSNKSLFIKLT